MASVGEEQIGKPASNGMRKTKRCRKHSNTSDEGRSKGKERKERRRGGQEAGPGKKKSRRETQTIKETKTVRNSRKQQTERAREKVIRLERGRHSDEKHTEKEKRDK